eukprot:TRINITY_DN16670_c0_g1_i1.p1 TRINITY_DN16670_c0_g1~~TRINITY_DN16670_c0_g1_i1.p1  ORF type:complete len:838 (+),score=235.25 TRINITY_DN16670_c0_g1_i1:41-2515(+)
MFRKPWLRMKLASRISELELRRTGRRYCSQDPKKPENNTEEAKEEAKDSGKAKEKEEGDDAKREFSAAKGKDGPKPPKGFEKWFPNPNNPGLPLAIEEFKKREAVMAKKKNAKKKQQKGSDQNDQTQVIFLTLGTALGLYAIYSWWSSRPHGTSIEWEKVKELVKEGHLVKVEIYDYAIAQLTTTENGEEEMKYYMTIGDTEVFEYRLECLQLEFNTSAQSHAIPVMYRTHDHGLLSLMWQCSLPLMVLYFFVYRFPKSQKALQSELFSKRDKKPKFEVQHNVSTKFKDVAGLKETKQEIMEVVDFLKFPDKYSRLGAKIPKGVLLTGPPGVGKTLLAKATAGESEVPFFSVAGSDFMEVFVGVGPARVRELFASAAKEAPCIVFIDEIDAIGRKRQTAGGGRHDSEQESALNSILVEMDGFNSKTGVVVLAGTNREDILDKALLRPGRFDRKITLDKPPLADRIEIFNLHLKPITLHANVSKNVTAKRLGALTPGFSGADIMNTCNEAALIAARGNENYVGMKSFEKAIEKILGGLEKTKKITLREKKMVAYHEAGHVVCGWHLKHVDPILKVSIVPRGGDKIGYAQHLPKDKYLTTQDELLESMVKLLGGMCAEEIIFGERSTGAADDMYRVTNMSKSQITRYGFSPEKVGHVSFPDGGSDLVIQNPYSKHTEKLIDEEVERIVTQVYETSMGILTKHKDQLDLVAEKLIEKEVLSAEDLTELLGERPFQSTELLKYLEAAAESRKEEGEAETSKASTTPDTKRNEKPEKKKAEKKKKKDPESKQDKGAQVKEVSASAKKGTPKKEAKKKTQKDGKNKKQNK